MRIAGLSFRFMQNRQAYSNSVVHPSVLYFENQVEWLSVLDGHQSLPWNTSRMGEPSHFRFA